MRAVEFAQVKSFITEMEANGGLGIGDNMAGAAYGTGYCDAQCPHDIKFIDGEANVINWTPNPKDQSNNMGAGKVCVPTGDTDAFLLYLFDANLIVAVSTYTVWSLLR